MSMIFGCPHYWAENDMRCQLHRGHDGDHVFELQTSPTVQHYWRCAHHPSAIENFFAKPQLLGCEWDCQTQSLRWYHNGEHPMPKSWGTPHGQDR